MELAWEERQEILLQKLNNEKCKFQNEEKTQEFDEIEYKKQKAEEEKLWKKYPASRPVDKNGKSLEKINWYAGVCPNNPDVRKIVHASINRLIEAYSVDGLWLDFIRYPCYWEDVRSDAITEYCFCKICLEKFRNDGGKKPEGKEWIEWKCLQITHFASEIKHLTRKKRKNIKLGMFAIPWWEKEYGGAIKKIIGQDFKKLAKQIDAYSPMVYQKFCSRYVTWISQTVKYLSKMTKKPILPIIQTEDRSGKIYPNEFRSEILHAMKHPSKGVIIFFLEDLLKDNNKVKVTKEMFQLID